MLYKIIILYNIVSLAFKIIIVLQAKTAKLTSPSALLSLVSSEALVWSAATPVSTKAVSSTTSPTTPLADTCVTASLASLVSFC